MSPQALRIADAARREPVRDLSGVWLADIAASTFRGGGPAALRVTIWHADPSLQADFLALAEDGTDDRAAFACRTTGEEWNSTVNGNAIRGLARWDEGELILESWVRSGGREMYLCDCWSLSDDEQSLVMEHRNDVLTGQRVVLHRIPHKLGPSRSV